MIRKTRKNGQGGFSSRCKMESFEGISGAEKRTNAMTRTRAAKSVHRLREGRQDKCGQQKDPKHDRRHKNNSKR